MTATLSPGTSGTASATDLISAPDLNFLCALVRERSAIVLEPKKAYLLQARLEPLAKQLNLEGIPSLVKALRAGGGATLAEAVVDAMTTNETSFFRDIHPFEALRLHVLPQVLAARAAERRLSIWCAASSSGQEPYSIAMLLREHFPELEGWNVSFIASDISPTMLARCREGIYSQLEVNRGLPVTYLVKHFEKAGGGWQLKPEIRRRVDFREMNLIRPWPTLPAMDIVFIRNVLIYFDMDVRKQILGKIHDLMRPGGFLFLGTAETTLNLEERFRRATFDKTTLYHKALP